MTEPKEIPKVAKPVAEQVTAVVDLEQFCSLQPGEVPRPWTQEELAERERIIRESKAR